MLSIERNKLSATIPCASQKDIRYYLNGVLLEVATCGDIHLVSTDGRAMFIGRIAADAVKWTGEPQKGPWSMIVPIDAVKTAIKTKTPRLELVALPDGRYSLADTIFTPIDGIYPDWRRVATYSSGPVETAQFDPDLLSECFNSLRTWHDNKKLVPYVRHRGENTAYVTAGEGAYCCIMPWRVGHDAPVEPFIPAAL